MTTNCLSTTRKTIKSVDRRTVLVGSVSAAAVPAFGHHALASEPSADHELLRLGGSLQKAIERFENCTEAVNRADAKFKATCPAEPESPTVLPRMFDDDGSPRQDVIRQIGRAEVLRWETYRKEKRRAWRESGIDEAQDKQGRTIEAANKIARQIMKLPAATAAGLALKLKAVRWLHPDDEVIEILDSIEGDVEALV